MTGKAPQYEHWVTLYADGGFHPEHGGTYAFRTRHSLPPIRMEEHGSVVCADNNVAEMAAIVLGVERIVQTYERVDGLWIRTDSEAAILMLKPRAERHRRADMREWQERLRTIVEPRRIWLNFKWVQGHQKPGSLQGWLNSRVDQLATRARREVASKKVP